MPTEVRSDAYNASQTQPTPRTFPNCQSLAQRVILVSTAALFIIGCLSGAGVIQIPTIGWIAAGLAGGTLMLNFYAMKNLKENKVNVLIWSLAFASTLSLGMLGGFKILTIDRKSVV